MGFLVFVSRMGASPRVAVGFNVSRSARALGWELRQTLPCRTRFNPDACASRLTFYGCFAPGDFGFNVSRSAQALGWELRQTLPCRTRFNPDACASRLTFCGCFAPGGFGFNVSRMCASPRVGTGVDIAMFCTLQPGCLRISANIFRVLRTGRIWV